MPRQPAPLSFTSLHHKILLSALALGAAALMMPGEALAARKTATTKPKPAVVAVKAKPKPAPKAEPLRTASKLPALKLLALPPPDTEVRPPQFVVLAFDGSQSHEMWRQTIDLAKSLTEQGKPTRFTYFISGVYFLAEKNRRLYDAPGRGPGRSAIGWGSSKDNDIAERIARVNEAHEAGHEIASHANGHFDGGSWSEAQWKSEFAQFNRLLFEAAKNNELPTDGAGSAPALSMEKRSIVGFRAPQLGISKGLWPTLESHGFRYDTSRSALPDYWPKKLPQSGWNFPLAEIKIPGTATRTLSMDYNFYYAQSGARPYTPKSGLFEQQMYEAYIQYFNANYTGNRAPVHIGHHFSLWNGGAYWRAFQRFAKAVCGKSEVKCVTYRELADYLDAQKPETIAAWQKARFPKMANAETVKTTLGPPLDLKLALAKPGRDGRIALEIGGRDWRPADYTLTFEINGEAAAGRETTLGAIRAAQPKGAKVTVGWRLTKGDVEVARLTHVVTGLGTASERLSAEPLEVATLRGHPSCNPDDPAHDHEHF